MTPSKKYISRESKEYQKKTFQDQIFRCNINSKYSKSILLDEYQKYILEIKIRILITSKDIHELYNHKKHLFYIDCSNTKTTILKSCDPKKDTFYQDGRKITKHLIAKNLDWYISIHIPLLVYTSQVTPIKTYVL